MKNIKYLLLQPRKKNDPMIEHEEECLDDDVAMDPIDCATAVMIFTCEGEYNGLNIADACPVTCFGNTCDYFVNTLSVTCEVGEKNYGCDCSGCVCEGTFVSLSKTMGTFIYIFLTF